MPDADMSEEFNCITYFVLSVCLSFVVYCLWALLEIKRLRLTLSMSVCHSWAKFYQELWEGATPSVGVGVGVGVGVEAPLTLRE